MNEEQAYAKLQEILNLAEEIKEFHSLEEIIDELRSRLEK